MIKPLLFWALVAFVVLLAIDRFSIKSHENEFWKAFRPAFWSSFVIVLLILPVMDFLVQSYNPKPRVKMIPYLTSKGDHFWLNCNIENIGRIAF